MIVTYNTGLNKYAVMQLQLIFCHSIFDDYFRTHVLLSVQPHCGALCIQLGTTIHYNKPFHSPTPEHIHNWWS